MTTNTTKKAAGASNTNGLHTDTNVSNSRPGGAIDQAHSKAISTRDTQRLTTGSASLIEIKGQNLFVSSTAISRLFGRPHKNVMRDIDRLVKTSKIWGLSPERRDYLDSRGKVQRSFTLTERDALVLMPLLGGRKAAYLQAKLVDEFLRMRKELRRLARRKSDPAIQQTSREKCAAAIPMTDALTCVRKVQGKETHPVHFGNEHKLCNWVLTGQRDHIDDRNLDRSDLLRLKEVRQMNTHLIYQGKTHAQRKAALREAFPLPLPLPGGDDVSA